MVWGTACPYTHTHVRSQEQPKPASSPTWSSAQLRDDHHMLGSTPTCASFQQAAVILHREGFPPMSDLIPLQE